MLNDAAADSERARYALRSLLSTLGLPFEFIPNLDEAIATLTDRQAHLVIGEADPARIACLARKTAVVVVPGPNLPMGIGGERSIPDPRQIRVLEEPIGAGYLVRVAGDLIGSTFALIARTEEYAVSTRDEHDRFRWIDSGMEPAELAARPLVSEYAQLLLTCLKEACVQAGVPLVRKEFWPLGRPMAGCLTHDVDVVRRGRLPRGIAIRDVKGALSAAARGRLGRAAAQVTSIARTAARDQDPYWTFDRISAIETRHGYRSTYYFMTGNHHPEDVSYDLGRPPMAGLLQLLKSSRDEIGLHGSYSSYKDPELLKSMKEKLERHFGLPVFGHRNHYLRFRVPESWNAQEAGGFSYDATLGFHDREGFRGSHAFPFHPYDLAGDRTLDLLEIPLAVMDVTLFKYRHLQFNKALEAVSNVLDQTRSVHGLVTLLWHNHTFFDHEYPGSGKLYEATLDWLAEGDAYVATAQEIDSWWRAREAVKLAPLDESSNGWRMECPREIAGLVLRVGLPNPRSSLRVRGQVPLSVRRDGTDYLLEFGLLAAGFSLVVEYTE